MLDRRTFIEAVGATLAIPSFFLKGEKPEQPAVMQLTCVLDTDTQVGKIDLNGTTDQIHIDINKTLWWPDGNSQGVMDVLQLPKGIYKTARLMPKNNRILLRAKKFCSIEEFCEVEIKLKDGNTLRFNRFWHCIYNADGKSIIGSSVGYPTGYYGHRHILGLMPRIYGHRIAPKNYKPPSHSEFGMILNIGD